MITLYEMIGSAVCHRIPSRTLWMDGLPLPVCARDTGIYLGLFASVLFLLVKRRFRADRLPSIPHAIIMVLWMLPMIFDGVSSYAGFRETNNVIRLVTGVFFGLPIPFFLIPAANYQVSGRNTKKVLGGWGELISILAVGVALCLMVLKTSLFPWAVLGTVIAFSILFTIGRILYTLVARTRYGTTKSAVLLSAVATVVVLGVLYTVSHVFIRPWAEELLH